MIRTSPWVKCIRKLIMLNWQLAEAVVDYFTRTRRPKMMCAG